MPKTIKSSDSVSPSTYNTTLSLPIETNNIIVLKQIYSLTSYTNQDLLDKFFEIGLELKDSLLNNSELSSMNISDVQKPNLEQFEMVITVAMHFFKTDGTFLIGPMNEIKNKIQNEPLFDTTHDIEEISSPPNKMTGGGDKMKFAMVLVVFISLATLFLNKEITSLFNFVEIFYLLITKQTDKIPQVVYNDWFYNKISQPGVNPDLLAQNPSQMFASTAVTGILFGGSSVMLPHETLIRAYQAFAFLQHTWWASNNLVFSPVKGMVNVIGAVISKAFETNYKLNERYILPLFSKNKSEDTRRSRRQNTSKSSSPELEDVYYDTYSSEKTMERDSCMDECISKCTYSRGGAKASTKTTMPQRAAHSHMGFRKGFNTDKLGQKQTMKNVIGEETINYITDMYQNLSQEDITTHSETQRKNDIRNFDENLLEEWVNKELMDIKQYLIDEVQDAEIVDNATASIYTLLESDHENEMVRINTHEKCAMVMLYAGINTIGDSAHMLYALAEEVEKEVEQKSRGGEFKCGNRLNSVCWLTLELYIYHTIIGYYLMATGGFPNLTMLLKTVMAGLPVASSSKMGAFLNLCAESSKTMFESMAQYFVTFGRLNHSYVVEPTANFMYNFYQDPSGMFTTIGTNVLDTLYSGASAVAGAPVKAMKYILYNTITTGLSLKKTFLSRYSASSYPSYQGTGGIGYQTGTQAIDLSRLPNIAAPIHYDIPQQIEQIVEEMVEADGPAPSLLQMSSDYMGSMANAFSQSILNSVNMIRNTASAFCEQVTTNSINLVTPTRDGIPLVEGVRNSIIRLIGTSAGTEPETVKEVIKTTSHVVVQGFSVQGVVGEIATFVGLFYMTCRVYNYLKCIYNGKTLPGSVRQTLPGLDAQTVSRLDAQIEMSTQQVNKYVSEQNQQRGGKKSKRKNKRNGKGKNSKKRNIRFRK